jgi:hypothetical protein
MCIRDRFYIMHRMQMAHDQQVLSGGSILSMRALFFLKACSLSFDLEAVQLDADF